MKAHDNLSFILSGVVNESSLAWHSLLSIQQNRLLDKNVGPQIFLAATSAEARKIAQALESIAPRHPVFLAPSFDEAVYSPASPPPSYYARKCLFLWRALLATPDCFFVIPIDEFVKKTLPKNVFVKNTVSVGRNFELNADFISSLRLMGYQETPTVEEPGQFCNRGGIFDIYSPAEEFPVRLELFAEFVESLRPFDPISQISLHHENSSEPITIDQYALIPNSEVILSTMQTEEISEISAAVQKWRSSLQSEDENLGSRATSPSKGDTFRIEELSRAFQKCKHLSELRFLLPFIYPKPGELLDYFKIPPRVWWYQPHQNQRAWLDLGESASPGTVLDPLAISKSYFYYFSPDEFTSRKGLSEVRVTGIRELVGAPSISPHETEEVDSEQAAFDCQSQSVLEITKTIEGQPGFTSKWSQTVEKKFQDWIAKDFRIIIFGHSQSFLVRFRAFSESHGLKLQILDQNKLSGFESFQDLSPNIYYLESSLPEGFISHSSKVILIKSQELVGKRGMAPQAPKLSSKSLGEEGQRPKPLPIQEPSYRKDRALFFSDIKEGDLVIHEQHGLAVFEGLKKISLGDISTEFVTLKYKDNDRLYVPIYRLDQVHKYSSPSPTALLDKLGGKSWDNIKTRARKAMQDLAQELLQLYAKRSQIAHTAYEWADEDLEKFESEFIYQETIDQIRAIDDIKKDLTGTCPMDRLLCGDVGFGKTEVAMRAAFMAMASGRQVALICPTTVLCFQHLESFRDRFKNWPFKIEGINRFVSTKEQKRILTDVADGRCQLLIGTHRLLSKDVAFKNLGLLVIDEEHKFGVAHKDRIKKLKVEIDCLAMSATPIPRSLNFSFLGIRDFSFINSPPVDRLPVKTAVIPWDIELVKKAIDFEVNRGGQVYFIHNRIQTIYDLYDQLSSLFPSLRIRVAHGQMEEADLEEVMVKFFRKEIDILVCTAIVESGVNVLTANTMFIDLPHLLGLAQLYQLRGRVGRTNLKGYCYLVLPKNLENIDEQVQERLKILQDNTALGSGIRIAQYDLEIRGAGNFLGTEQSGHVASLGYEMYMDLLQETVAQLKGEEISRVEPEVNLKIPAYIPEDFIPDVRLRLSFYKVLSEIKKPEDLDLIEQELRERFGNLPEEVVNLCGVMLIRLLCKQLGIQDLSTGPKSISLVFSDATRVKPDNVLNLTQKSHKKYALVSPGNRLNIRLDRQVEKLEDPSQFKLGWSLVHQELSELIQKLL